jgi:CheY-like chemotaxis protein
MVNSSEYYSIPQAAKICGVDRTTMWNWVKAGKVKAFVTPGGHHRIQHAAIESLFQVKPGSPEPSHKKIILIVDDDPLVRDTFSIRLERENFQVETAADGFQAGLKVLQVKPDLVLLDLFMAGIDGFEVCRTIKQNPELESTIVLAMTGQDTPENKNRSRSAGADGYLSKMIDFKTVLMHINSFLSGKETKNEKQDAQW